MAHRFIDGLPNLKMGGFSMVMLNNQMVPNTSRTMSRTTLQIEFHSMMQLGK
jgi:hypothetical protein